jgi:hypothetical protein
LIKRLCYLTTSDYGVGLPHLRIKALVESNNKLIGHLGLQLLGWTLYQLSVELLVNEVGLYPQLILLDYMNWVMSCSLKETWARILHFWFTLHYAYQPCTCPPMPRVRMTDGICKPLKPWAILGKS